MVYLIGYEILGLLVVAYLIGRPWFGVRFSFQTMREEMFLTGWSSFLFYMLMVQIWFVIAPTVVYGEYLLVKKDRKEKENDHGC